MLAPSRSCFLEHIVQQMRSLAFSAALSVLAACSPDTPPSEEAASLDAVAGVLTHTELTQLSPEATIEVELADVSNADGAEIVSTQRIRNPGQLPVHFRLEYAPGRIDATHRYTVQARINDGGRIVFATDTAYPVITEGNPRTVEVAMVAVGGRDAALAATASEPPLEGTLTAGGITANYSARFEGDQLISIQEDRDAGAAGKAGAEYQFKEGRLLRYIELGRRTGPTGSSQVELDFAFDDTGELLAAVKTVDDAGVKPDETEIDAVRNRADLLRNHALALKASREHIQ